MAAENAIRGEDIVILGTDRVEVSQDGKKVTAYTNVGVETRAAAGAATQGFRISTNFNSIDLNGATIERADDGHLVISSSGAVITKPAPANGSVSATVEPAADGQLISSSGTVITRPGTANGSAIIERAADGHLVISTAGTVNDKRSDGEDIVIIGTDRVDVSPDGKKVTAYTNDGVETKAASNAAAQGISISADFNTVVLNGAIIERAPDGHLVISSSGAVIIRPAPAR